jgi:truncated hemoglobin YjbI/ankyrin repeat protein
MNARLEHRRFLREDESLRPFRGVGFFERVGGQAAVDRLVDELYDRLEGDDVLGPLFGRNPGRERTNEKLFFAEWLGGPRRYSEVSYAGLQRRHDALPITRALAGRWLGHFRHALGVALEDADAREAVFRHAEALAFALVNDQAVAPNHRGMKRLDANQKAVAWCGVDARTLTRAAEHAHRGDVRGLAAALKEAPDLLRPGYGAKLLQAAVLSNRLDVVTLLVERGVDPNKPHCLDVRASGLAFERVLFVTPLCAARYKRRSKVESRLIEAGAKADVFTFAFLGDLAALEAELDQDRALAQAPDPAVDVLDITPVHHAIAGRRPEALRVLLARVAEPLAAAGRALRGAAERNDAAMVELLLARGADATKVGAGRWVLHPSVAPLLAANGARAGRSGAWIGGSCTGNQGRKDDPALVRALLDHGARATDERVANGVRASALHFAVKAGFVKTIEVLLERGADPEARDSKGRTPLDWLEDAAKSVDKAAVRRAIRRHAKKTG